MFTVEERCNAIFNWAENSKAKFDTGFVNSLLDAYEKYGQLTPRQEQALDNIIFKFKIDVAEWCY